MNEEFEFELSPWEAAIDTLRPGQSMDGLHLFSLLEEESDDFAREALEQLEERHIRLSLDRIPRAPVTGASADRLAWEHTLARQGDLLKNLPENDPLALYLQELAAIPTTGATDLYLHRYLEGDEKAAELLANCMLCLVIEEARLRTGWGVLLQDLIQEGSLGLWKGILCYEAGDFTQHCLYYIRQHLDSAIFLQLRSSGLGNKLRQGMEDYLAADQQLLTELGRNATLEEIADRLHLTAEEAQVYEKMLENARLRQQAEHAMAPKEPSPEDDMAVEDTAYFQSRERVMELLSALTPQQAQLLSLRFGLEGGLPMNPADVGEKMNLTADQVVAMEAAALQKLRQG